MRPRTALRNCKTIVAVIFFLIIEFLGSISTHAGECRNSSGDPFSQQDFTARLQFLRASLRETARQERRFALGWSLTYVGFAAGTWALLPFSEDQQGKRKASAWNSATSLAAALQVLIDPLLVIRDHRRMEALAGLPIQQHERCAILIKAEQLLQHAANSETSARSAKAHILSFLTTVGLGLVLGYALEQPESAAINTTLGIALGEIMIATRPTSAIRQLENYRRGDLRTPVRSDGLALGLIPLRTDNGYGVAIGGIL